jgi:hypothetical protein
MDNDVINRNKEHEKGADLRLVALNNFWRRGNWYDLTIKWPSIIKNKKNHFVLV